MSISGIFPAVRLLDGERYVDGGMRFNLPLLSNWKDFDDVWLLIGHTKPEDYVGNDIVSNLIRNVNILRLDQIQDVLDETKGAPNVHVIWPDVSSAASMLHFDHSLIGESYRATITQLQKEKLA